MLTTGLTEILSRVLEQFCARNIKGVKRTWPP